MSLRDTPYMDHDDETVDMADLPLPAYLDTRSPAAVREDAPFTPLEAQVIAIARTDTLASLEAPGRLERFVAVVFGLKARVRALADEKLETLRRAVVLTNHRHHMPDAVAAELRKVGFGAIQVRAIEALATQG